MEAVGWWHGAAGDFYDVQACQHWPQRGQRSHLLQAQVPCCWVLIYTKRSTGLAMRTNSNTLAVLLDSCCGLGSPWPYLMAASPARLAVHICQVGSLGHPLLLLAACAAPGGTAAAHTLACLQAYTRPSSPQPGHDQLQRTLQVVVQRGVRCFSSRVLRRRTAVCELQGLTNATSMDACGSVAYGKQHIMPVASLRGVHISHTWTRQACGMCLIHRHGDKYHKASSSCAQQCCT